MPSTVIEIIIITRAETKIIKDKTKRIVRVLKVFTLSYIISLRPVIKLKHS